MNYRAVSTLLLAVLLAHSTRVACAEGNENVLSKSDSARVEQSIDRALQWLSSQQQRNGSFPTMMQGQPGVTSLGVLAFAAQGHLPGEGAYGSQLQAAIDFMRSCQKPSGLLAQVAPLGSKMSRNVSLDIGSTAVYNHALTALVLSEVFSMSGGDIREQQETIEAAIQATLEMQTWLKPLSADEGGWRYLTYRAGKPDSDLSVTGWQVMFLRSAKNAGFDVPDSAIRKAVAYIRRCFHADYRTFTMLANKEDRRSRGMAGAGKEGFPIYNESRYYAGGSYTDDRYHYAVFCASQAMYQLGGNSWQKFFPPVVEQILTNQQEDGSWEPDRHLMDAPYGRTYTTALMVLTLSTPNQLLPIFQR